MDPSQVGTSAGSTPTGGRMARSARGGRLALGVVGLIAVAAIARAALGGGGGGGSGPDAEDGLSEVRELTEEERAERAAEDEAASDALRAFAQAARSIELAGSYAYDGTVHAPEASDARPAHAPSPDVTVEGEVLWPLRTHDVAFDATGRAAETITVGPTIWQRRASTVAGLATMPYAFVGDVTTWTGAVVPFGAGAARIPGWLSATVDRSFGSERDGRRSYVAVLPADRLGETVPGAPAADADVVLTVDADGAPLHVEIDVPASSSRDVAPWRISVDITGLGDPVTVDIPDGELPGVTEGPSTAEVRAAGIAAPVELGRLPDGWMLAGIRLAGDDQRPECPRLELDYFGLASTSATSGHLSLTVLPPPCALENIDGGPPAEPLRAGPFVGGTARFGAGMGGVLTDGRTTVEFVSSLPNDDVLRLLATLEPYDPATRPTVLDAAS